MSYVMTTNLSERGDVLLCCLFGATLALHIVLPPWTAVPGYACDCSTKKVLRYRFNGFATLVYMLIGCALLVRWDIVSPSALAKGYWAALRTACGLGLGLSAFLYVRGKARLARGAVDRGATCLTVNGPRSDAAKEHTEFDARSSLAHFYCGIEWNPRVALLGVGVDVKMFNYVVGAMGLACNVLSAVALHLEQRGGLEWANLSWAMLAYAAPMLWFVSEYLCFENVHVYTYDIFCERTGAKMCWGCWCFYPFFYCVGAWPIVELASEDKDIHAATALACVMLFAAGWLTTRGANLQKWLWRSRAGNVEVWKKQAAKKLGIEDWKTVPGSNDRLLCGGWWGYSRHVNYFGEIVQAVALALPGWLATGSVLPWLYPLYYVALFIPRQIDDDQRCLAKYGEVWKTYEKLVPYRIVPGVY